MMKLLMIIFLSIFHQHSSSLFSNYTIAKFQRLRDRLRVSKNVLVITGAGLSCHETVPTIGSINKFYEDANLKDFLDSPTTVWKYFQSRRNFVLSIIPNKALRQLADFEERCLNEGRKFTLITQNIDELHQKSGSKNVIELHGSIFKTKCTVCGDIQSNYQNPVCPSLDNRKIKHLSSSEFVIPCSELPRCKKNNCNGLLKPFVNRFNETLEFHSLQDIDKIFEDCDICLLFGTSPVISIAIELGSKLLQKKVPIAGFNIVSTSPKPLFQFYFSGPIYKIIAEALII